MRANLLAIAAGLSLGVSSAAHAAISYSVSGSEYSQGFDNGVFPTSTTPDGRTIYTNNAGHLLSLSPATTGTPLFPEGWADDATSNADHVSAPGWHLWHQTTLAASAGGNHQTRYGNGGLGTSGSFYLYALASTDFAEKSVGIVSADGIQGSGGRAYIGLQLTNDTAETLTSFTITYDGEQWRNGSTSGLRDGFDFQYSTAKTDANWTDSSDYSGIADSFLSPVDTATVGGLDGNLAANRIANITHTFTDIQWLPGTELWIRWRDRNLTGSDDGIAIDNVRFSAVPEPTSLAVLGLGLTGLLTRRRSR